MQHAPITPDPTLDLALDILARGPRLAVDSCMPESRVGDWTKAAQAAVDGDCTDLNDLEEEWAEADRSFVWDEPMSARQARLDQAALDNPRYLSPKEAMQAREHAWALCKLLCGPNEGSATEAAHNYKFALDLIEAREVRP